MKIEKVGKQYRVRKQIKGKKITLTFDHKPDAKEVIDALSQYDVTAKGTFESCADGYIKSKSNVLSPSTINGYRGILDILPNDFKEMPISRIAQADVQTVINNYAAEHKPKTVRNVHGFISAVLRQYRPSLNLYTTLPQRDVNEPYTPSEDDIKRILDACVGTRYHIPFLLGVMGLRRSEICALTLDDVDADNNILSIDKAMVLGEDNKWFIKSTKTTAGTRKIYIPDSLIKEIEESNAIYNGHPSKLLYNLSRFLKQLGIPHFRFHDLRHFFASYAHSQGISDADIMASGGWKSDYTMKSIYRHEMKASEAQKKIYDSLIK